MKRNSLGYRHVFFSNALIFIFLNFGCSDIKGAKNRADSILSQRAFARTTNVDTLQIFESSFYNKVALVTCKNCHAFNQSPRFASPDLQTAYSEASDPKYVNFSKVGLAGPKDFITYANNGHCNSDTLCRGLASVVRAQIQIWATAEITPPSNNNSNTGGSPSPSPSARPIANSSAPFVTGSLALPTTPPTPTTGYYPLRWSLTGVAPALSGAVLEIELQLFNGYYKLRNPKIAGLKTAVEIRGIHLYIKKASESGIGREDPGTSGRLWNLTAALVASSTLPTLGTATLSATTFPPLSADANFISPLSATAPGNDLITVGFNEVITGTTIPASYMALYNSTFRAKCMSCHTFGNTSGGQDFSQYETTLRAAVPKQPDSSAIYRAVTDPNVTTRMPKGTAVPLTTPEINAIKNWILWGAPNN